MVKCNRCKQFSLNSKICSNCGCKLIAQPNAKPENPKVEVKTEVEKSETTKRLHGFSRLGAELGDPEMSAICDKGAADIPHGHPVERFAETIADTLAFAKTPGGKVAVEGIKKGIMSIFGG